MGALTLTYTISIHVYWMEKGALELFWLKDTYEERIAFLEVIYKENYVSSRGLFGKYSIHTPAEGGRTCT